MASSSLWYLTSSDENTFDLGEVYSEHLKDEDLKKKYPNLTVSTVDESEEVFNETANVPQRNVRNIYKGPKTETNRDDDTSNTAFLRKNNRTLVRATVKKTASPHHETNTASTTQTAADVTEAIRRRLAVARANNVKKVCEEKPKKKKVSVRKPRGDLSKIKEDVRNKNKGISEVERPGSSSAGVESSVHKARYLPKIKEGDRNKNKEVSKEERSGNISSGGVDGSLRSSKLKRKYEDSFPKTDRTQTNSPSNDEKRIKLLQICIEHRRTNQLNERRSNFKRPVRINCIQQKIPANDSKNPLNSSLMEIKPALRKIQGPLMDGNDKEFWKKFDAFFPNQPTVTFP